MDSELKNKFDISKLDESLTYFQTILKQIKDIQTSISNYNLELENNNYPLTLKLLPKIEDKLKKFSQTQQKFPELKIEFLENYVSQINSWISNEKNLKPKKRQHYVDSFFNQMGDHFKSCNLPLNGHNPTFSSKNFKFILDSNKLKINIVYGGDEEKMHLFDGLSLTDVSLTIKNFYEYFDKLELSLLNVELSVITLVPETINPSYADAVIIPALISSNDTDPETPVKLDPSP